MQKRCNACKVTMSLEGFHKNKRGKFGVQSVCKSCTLAYFKTPAGRAARARTTAKYNKSPAGRVTTAKYKKTPGGRAVHARVRATPEGRNKRKAHHAVSNAIRDGKLTRPDVCSVNDSVCEGRIEGHHHKGYERAFWLDVEWLCIAHHAIEGVGSI